jgi:hypothetical protein
MREFEIPVEDFPTFKECVLRGNEWITESSAGQELPRISQALSEKTKQQRFPKACTSPAEKPRCITERISERETALLPPVPEAQEPQRDKMSFPDGSEGLDTIPEKPKRTRRRRKRNAGAKQAERREIGLSQKTLPEKTGEKTTSLEENEDVTKPSEAKRHADSLAQVPHAGAEERSRGKTSPDEKGEKKQKPRRRRRPRRKPQTSPSEENHSAEKPHRTTVDATSKG